MLERIRRHFRGNVVGYLALFVALSGTAVASGVLNKKKVNKIITNRAHGLSVARAQSADNASLLGGQGPGAFQQRVRWALVATDGTILAQSGGISNDKHTAGQDSLNFGSSQVGKAIIATLSGAGGGEESAVLCGGHSNPGGTDCLGMPNDVDHITVSSFNSGGSSAPAQYWVAVIG